MFQHIVYSLANRQGLFAYIRTCKLRFDTTTRFMVVVTSLFNLVISSFADNMFYRVWAWLLIYHDVPTTLFKLVRSTSHEVCSNMHEQACKQHMFKLASSTMLSLTTTLFKLASSTMFKPVNNTVQAGQLNHVQACQQHCSS